MSGYVDNMQTMEQQIFRDCKTVMQEQLADQLVGKYLYEYASMRRLGKINAIKDITIRQDADGSMYAMFTVAGRGFAEIEMLTSFFTESVFKHGFYYADEQKMSDVQIEAIMKIRKQNEKEVSV